MVSLKQYIYRKKKFSEQAIYREKIKAFIMNNYYS